MADDKNEDKGGTGKEDLSAFLEGIKGIIGDKKDAAAINDALIKDNFQLRESRRKLKEQLPAEGSVILTPDEAEVWQGFKELNLTPDEVVGVLTEYDELNTTVTTGDAAEALGWDREVLRDLVVTQGLPLVMEEAEVEENGAKVKKSLPFVTENDKKVRLDEYEPLKKFHQSLVKDGSDGGTGGRAAQTGVRLPATRSSSAGGSGGRQNGPSQVVQNHIASRYPRPSQRGQVPDKK